MRKLKLRDVYVAFGGDPSDDREVYKRYSSTEPFKPVLPNEEIVHAREVRFVQMKPLKELVRNKIISIVHMSDDGEFMRYKILPNGPEVGQWVSGDEKLLVVNCSTVHENFLMAYPQLYNEVKNEDGKEMEA